MASAIPAFAYKVYFDNTDTKWTQPKIYYWGDAEVVKWPGVDMISYTDNDNLTNIWYYEVPDQYPNIIFNDGNGSQTIDYKGSSTAFDGHVFTYIENGTSGKTYEDADQGLISEYTQGTTPEDPVNTEYTVYFERPSTWDSTADVHVYVWDKNDSDKLYAGNWTGTVISKDPEHEPLYSYTFTCTNATPSLYVIFNNGSSDSGETKGTNQTGDLELKNGWVYQISGAKCYIDDYTYSGDDPDDPDDPDNPYGLEYWLAPASPSQNEAATLYFDRTKGDGKLNDTNDIYIYTGVILENESEWSHTNDWNNMTDTYKMQPIKSGSNVYSITFTPTIAEWYGISDIETAAQIAVIFRDKSGNNKQDSGTDSGNHFIELTKAPIDPTMSPLGKFVSASEENGTVTIQAEKGQLQITPYGENIVKIFTLPANATSTEERKSISVAIDEPDVDFSSSMDDDFYYVNITGGTTVKVDKLSCLVTFLNADGTEALSEYRGLVNGTNSHTVTFQGMGDAGFYGGGYGGDMNMNGKTMLMDNYQSGGWPDQDSHSNHNICIPFYVSTNGYGVYFDDHYKGAKVMPSSGGSSYTSSALNPISYYFVGGGSMKAVMENYTELTGRQELPPYWALGYLTSKFSFTTQQEATDAITSTRNLGIPLDGLVFDIHWQGCTGTSPAWGMGKLDWDTSQYPDGDGIMQKFKTDYHVNSIAITEPFFNNDGDAATNYGILKDNGWLADDSVGNMSWVGSQVGLIDASNPDAMNWFATQYVEHTKNGMAGWWLDLGEPEQHDNDSGTTHAGGTFEQVHNEYGNLWIEGVYNKLKTEFPDMRQFFMPRAGTAGMQRFSTFPWTGDIMRSWNGLAVQIPALVNGSMSGIGYLGSDIGGFRSSGTNSSLYLRWVELGVFYPMMRTHSADQPEPFNSCYSDVVTDVKNFIRMRYSYLPYTYTLSYWNTVNGTPLARPANFADADKSVLADCKDQYLWGENILVAPVVSDNTTRSITFPEGRWLDLNNGKDIYEGHTTTNYTAPLNLLPHFLREGSMVPRYNASTCNGTYDLPRGRVILECFPDGQTGYMDGYLYEDDGTSAASLKNGEYAMTYFAALSLPDSNNPDYDNLALSINNHDTDLGNALNGYTGHPESREYIIHIYGHDHPDGGTFYVRNLDSPQYAPMRAAADTEENFEKVNSTTDLESTTSENAYYVDSENSALHIKVTIPNTRGTSYALKAGVSDIFTGVRDVEITGNLSVAYANGTISYSVPEGVEDASIAIYNVTGTLMGEYSSLVANGMVNQFSVSLPSGVYVAKLTARKSDRAYRSATAKMLVQ